jgi:regulator of sigma D
MLDNCTIEERWSGVNLLIERWLQERQTIILQFCALSGVHELHQNADPSNIRLQNFCQLLMDYVSAGHFEIYYQLIREAEMFQDGSAEHAKALIPEITATTSAAIDFNDRYVDANGNLDQLPKSLSTLGETLAARFELEDGLIDSLHESHRDLVA